MIQKKKTREMVDDIVKAAVIGLVFLVFISWNAAHALIQSLR